MNLFDIFSLDESTTMLLTNLSSILGIILFIATTLVSIFKLVGFIREYTRGFHQNLTGIYIAYATNLQVKNNGRFIHDIIEFKRSFKGNYIGSVAYSNESDRNHQISIKQSKTNPSFFEGQWKNLDDRNTFGYVQFAHKENFLSKQLSGIWTGTTKAEEINGGQWYFKFSF